MRWFSYAARREEGAVKYVLFYDAAADMDRAREVFPAHRAKWQEFVARGELLMIGPFSDPRQGAMGVFADRKSTRLNSSHLVISYAVFCLKKKKKEKYQIISEMR